MQHSVETITRKGVPYVVLPKADYDALMEQLEDAADQLALEAVLARAEEGFPMALFDAIRAGESPLRLFREYRGMTQEALAAASGISRNFITMIETGKRTGKPVTLKALATALEVEMDMLVV